MKITWKKTLVITLITYSLISIGIIYFKNIRNIFTFYFPAYLIYNINILIFVGVFYVYQKDWFNKIISLKYYKIVNRASEYIFLTSLTTIFLNTILKTKDSNFLRLVIKLFGESSEQFINTIQNNFQWPQTIIQYLIITAIITGSFSIWINYLEQIKKKHEQDHIIKEKRKNKRYERIKQAWPIINRKGAINTITEWLRKNGLRFHFLLIIITILFICLKLWMPFFYNVSYVDEYFHISSAESLINTGHLAQFSMSGTYNRGLIMTLLVSLAILIKNHSLLIVKLVPAIIGIINFFLFYFIAKKIINNRIIIILALIIFALNPWTIFNHFYIRFYVIYEMFLLLILYLFSLLIDFNRNKKNKKILLTVILLFGLYLIINLLSNDAGKYPLLLSIWIGFTYLFISAGKKNNNSLEEKDIIKDYVDRVLNLNNIYKLTIIALLAIILFFLFKVPARLYLLNNYRASGLDFSMKYAEFFFSIQWIFVLLSIITLPIVSITKNKFKKILIITADALLLIHLLSNYNFQIIRGVLYLIPVIILSAMVGLDNLYYLFKKNSKAVLYIKFSLLIIIIATTIYNSYPNDFTKNPYIDKEIIPRDYSTASIFIKNNLKKHVIIDASHGAIASFTKFYEVEIDWHLDLNEHDLNVQIQERKKGREYDPFYYDKTGRMYSTYLKKPYITAEEFKKIIKDEKVAVILIEGSRWQFFTNELYSLMIRSLPFKREFLNLTIYFN